MSYTTDQAAEASRQLSSLTNYALDDIQTLVKERDIFTLSQLTGEILWTLLLHFCQHEAEAMPSLLVLLENQKEPIRAEDLPNDAVVKELVIHNNYHNHPIAVNYEISSEDVRRMQFAESIVQYCHKIREQAASKPSTGFKLRFGAGLLTPGEFLQQASSALGYGSINYYWRPVPAISEASDPKFWRSEIVFDKCSDIKISAVWVGRKPARLLNIIRICLALKPRLEAAYKVGKILPQEYQLLAKQWGEEVFFPSDPSASKELDETSAREVTLPISVADETVARMLTALRNLRDKGFLRADQDQYSPALYERKDKQIRGLRKRGWLDLQLQQEQIGRRRSHPLPDSNQQLLPLLKQHVSSRILTTIQTNDIAIITAATGSGKTTQIPQLIWDQYIDDGNGSVCNIVCTQPRRVSTISVAKRVACERRQPLSRDIGYSVRFDDRSPADGCGINYMTSGLLLRILEGDYSRLLASLSHIILDEVHTRDIDTDLLLTALKNLINRPAEERIKLPKIVLMSATIDAEYFADYFRDTDMPIKVSSINVPGTNHPVSTQRLQEILLKLEKRRPHEMALLLQNKALNSYIQSQRQVSSEPENNQSDISSVDADAEVVTSDVDDLDDLYVPKRLIPMVIDHVLRLSSSGDILVFLPGLGEIDDTEELLMHNNLGHDFLDTKSYQIFKLHSALYETNFDVFRPVPPGCRRIVLATNIAETSLTLPNVKFVVDTGLSRQSFYEQAMQSGQLKLVWISKAEVTQRRGRVGRTQPGHYIALYSNEQYESMVERPQPELTRTSLTQIALRVQESSAFQISSTPESSVSDADTVDPGIALLTAPSAPDRQKVIAAGAQLRNLKAITKEGDVTALGKALSVIPCNPPMAKAILLGSIFRCLNPLVLLGAQLQDCQIMANAISSSSVATVRKALAETSHDDNLANAKAFFDYDTARRAGDMDKVESMKTNMFLRHDTYREVSQTCNQIVETLTSVLGQHNKPSEQMTDVPYLFPKTSPLLNVNSPNDNLIKALALSTAGSKLAFWYRKDWRASNYPRILPSPRSVNHTSTKRAVREQRMKRENGDILAYSILRILPRDKYPWACDTSCVSPLSGILFAESVRLVESNKLMINDWISYGINTPSGETKTAAKVVLEYRKALDRFLNIALDKISLHPHELEKVVKGEMKASDFNVYLGDEDHPHRKIIVDSVIDILAIEAKARAERLEIRRLDTESAEATVASSNTEELIPVNVTNAEDDNMLTPAS